MTRNRKRRPLLGPAFDADQMNDAERIRAYIGELEYYRPRGFSKLAREGERIARALEGTDTPAACDAVERSDSWKDDVDTLLTEWARRVERHDYIRFGCTDHSVDVGFWIDVDRAREDADLTFPAGEVPRGVSGLIVTITDHGNVAAYRYSRGRMCRELFSVV